MSLQTAEGIDCVRSVGPVSERRRFRSVHSAECVPTQGRQNEDPSNHTRRMSWLKGKSDP